MTEKILLVDDEEAIIESIEFALRRSGGPEDMCLCLRYADAEELSVWQSLNIGGETLEVGARSVDAAPRGAA
jgi:hypothetical protein